MADYENNKQQSSFTLFNNETGKSYELPIIKGTNGPDVLDIRKLYQETGLFTYDPGFTSTGSCKSDITYIDGDKGVLLHRGYRIEDLAENCDYLEVAYLLTTPNRKGDDAKRYEEIRKDGKCTTCGREIRNSSRQGKISSIHSTSLISSRSRK